MTNQPQSFGRNWEYRYNMGFERMNNVPSPEVGGNPERARLEKCLADLKIHREDLVGKRDTIKENAEKSKVWAPIDTQEIGRFNDRIEETDQDIEGLKKQIEGLG